MSGDANHQPAEVITQMLIDLALGSNPDDELDWPIYFSFHPDEPNNSICVRDTEGRDQGRTQFDGEKQTQHGIQIAIRSETIGEGARKARSICIALDSQVLRRDVTVDSNDSTDDYVVQSVNRVGNPLSFRENPTSKRRVHTINATTSVRMQNAGTGTGTGN